VREVSSKEDGRLKLLDLKHIKASTKIQTTKLANISQSSLKLPEPEHDIVMIPKDTPINITSASKNEINKENPNEVIYKLPKRVPKTIKFLSDSRPQAKSCDDINIHNRILKISSSASSASLSAPRMLSLKHIKQSLLAFTSDNYSISDDIAISSITSTKKRKHSELPIDTTPTNNNDSETENNMNPIQSRIRPNAAFLNRFVDFLERSNAKIPVTGGCSTELDSSEADSDDMEESDISQRLLNFHNKGRQELTHIAEYYGLQVSISSQSIYDLTGKLPEGLKKRKNKAQDQQIKEREKERRERREKKEKKDKGQSHILLNICKKSTAIPCEKIKKKSENEDERERERESRNNNNNNNNVSNDDNSNILNNTSFASVPTSTSSNRSKKMSSSGILTDTAPSSLSLSSSSFSSSLPFSSSLSCSSIPQSISTSCPTSLSLSTSLSTSTSTSHSTSTSLSLSLSTCTSGLSSRRAVTSITGEGEGEGEREGGKRRVMRKNRPRPCLLLGKALSSAVVAAHTSSPATAGSMKAIPLNNSNIVDGTISENTDRCVSHARRAGSFTSFHSSASQSNSVADNNNYSTAPTRVKKKDRAIMSMTGGLPLPLPLPLSTMSIESTVSPVIDTETETERASRIETNSREQVFQTKKRRILANAASGSTGRLFSHAMAGFTPTAKR